MAKKNGTGRSYPPRGKGGGEEEREEVLERLPWLRALGRRKKRRREEGEWVFFILVSGDDGETPRGG